MTYFLLNVSVFEETVDNKYTDVCGDGCLLKFTAIHCMNKLYRLLFIAVLYAFIYAMVVVYVVALLFIMW